MKGPKTGAKLDNIALRLKTEDKWTISSHVWKHRAYRGLTRPLIEQALLDGRHEPARDRFEGGS